MASMAAVPLPESQYLHHFNSKCMNNNNNNKERKAKEMHQCISRLTSATPATTSSSFSIGSIRREEEDKWRGNNGVLGKVAALCREGRLKQALAVLDIMEQQGLAADPDIYTSLLKACCDMKTLAEGKKIHGHILVSGLHQNVVLCTRLVAMYATCGNLVDARLVFDNVRHRNVFLWNAMISAYVKNGFWAEALQIYHRMQSEGIQQDKFTFPCVLKACAGLLALQQGKEIHKLIITSGLESDDFVGNALVSMYARCCSLEAARQVFDGMPQRSVVSWNAVIAGYTQNGCYAEALELFHEMQWAGIKPDTATLVGILPACASLAALDHGTQIHDYIIKMGIESDVVVGSALVDMYAKCGRIEYARQLFDKMSQRNVISWNAMIAGYAQNGYADDALKLFRQMQVAGTKSNSITVLNVLPACVGRSALQLAKEIHGQVTRSGFDSDIFVENALVATYAKCETLELGRRVFDKMSRTVVGSWNAMIAGYAQNGHANASIKLFFEMQLAGMKPDSFTFGSVLLACAHLAALQQGKEIHGHTIRTAFASDVFVSNSLLAMYVKCGSMEAAHQVFDKITQKNVVSWNTMIAGYAQHAHGNGALSIFRQMQLSSMRPDQVTIVSALPACIHLAALQLGKEIHCYICKNLFQTDVSVWSALIDMYSKCGSIKDAGKVFNKMSQRDLVSWNVMIAGYGMHGYGENAITLFDQMQEAGMKPDHITFVAVLSACSHAGLVDEGWQYFNCMIQDFQIAPSVEHYACMVDLLGRAGSVYEALNFIKKMPVKPDAGVWGALLGACRVHYNIELAEHVAECLLELEPQNVGNYVLLSNIYAAVGRWDDVANIRTMMRNKALKKNLGCSWIEVENKVHAFHVGDKSHPQSEKIYAMLDSLDRQMKKIGYVPDTNFVLHDVEEEEKEHILFGHSEKLAIAFGLLNTSPGSPVRITKNLRVCGDCHRATKFITKIVGRDIIVRDANRFHYFKDGLCSCGDYW